MKDKRRKKSLIEETAQRTGRPTSDFASHQQDPDLTEIPTPPDTKSDQDENEEDEPPILEDIRWW